jgi:adenylate cyclase
MIMRFSAGSKYWQGFLVGFVGAAIASIFWCLGWLDLWEWKSYDWRAHALAEPGKATDEIVVVVLDQGSLDYGSREENGWSWPWPREIYSVILDYCKKGGARSVAFDVILTEPSLYHAEDDSVFGDAIAALERFAGTIVLSEGQGSTLRWPNDLPAPPMTINGLSDWLSQFDPADIVFPRASPPIPEVARNSAVLCNVNLKPDGDGVYRRTKLFAVFDGRTMPTLGIGAYLAAQKKSRIGIQSGSMHINGKTIPIDNDGNAILRFRGPPATYKRYTAAEVIESYRRLKDGKEPVIKAKDAFQDKYVFFGFTAPGLYDLKPAPVAGVYPGVEIHATLLDNFLSDDFIRPAPHWFTILFTLLLSITCSLLMTRLYSPVKGLVIGTGTFMIPVLFSLAAYSKGIWLPLVIPETAVVATIILVLTVHFAIEGRQRRFIKNAFKQYLSPAVIERLIKNPEHLKLGGERRELSIFFSDLEGFTSISEGLDPEDLTALLNEYLTAMTEIIHDEGGTVDKYEGDAIIAFWNAPLMVEEHAIKTVRAALRCQSELARLRPVFRKRIGKDMHMRVGINTGPAVVGNMGSKTRFDYTMLGDAVNLAARLEGINKEFFTYTAISHSTRQRVGDRIDCRELGRVTVVGRREPVTIYEPMTSEAHAQRRDTLEIFDRGLRRFYRGEFEKAAEIFDRILEADPPAKAYLKRSRDLLAHPPDHWQGIWAVTTK